MKDTIAGKWMAIGLVCRPGTGSNQTVILPGWHYGTRVAEMYVNNHVNIFILYTKDVVGFELNTPCRVYYCMRQQGEKWPDNTIPQSAEDGIQDQGYSRITRAKRGENERISVSKISLQI